MIAIDTNLLVYAHRSDSEWNHLAHPCLLGLLQGHATWAIPWPCIHEFYSVVTHPRIYSPPSTPRQAMSQIDVWWRCPKAILLSENEGYSSTLASLASKAQTKGPQIHDAHIAALCISHGVRELWTADRDFQRFPELTTRNPLVEPHAPPR